VKVASLLVLSLMGGLYAIEILALVGIYGR
jgi:hypothetical protein